MRITKKGEKKMSSKINGNVIMLYDTPQMEDSDLKTVEIKVVTTRG